MRYFLLVLFVIVGILIESGCFRESRVNATTTVVKGSGTAVFPIERIFELDGCNVYRFGDGDRTEYLSTCSKVSCIAPVCSIPTPAPTSKGDMDPKGGHRKLIEGEDEEK